MGTNKDFNPVIAELRHQGWQVEHTTQGHYRALSPNKGHQVVHFSASNDPHALKNTLSDLRKSGFVWPAPAKKDARSRPEAKDDDWIAAVNAAAEAAASESAPMSGTVLAQPATTTKEDPMDKLWNDLKEARSFYELYDEQLAESRRRLEEAQAAFRQAEEDRLRAAAALREAKARFDEAFAPPPEARP